MLHIHNGESTAHTLKESGFPGEHFAFNDVLISGPTPAGLSADKWRQLRAEFLSGEYGLTLDNCANDLRKQEETLNTFAQHDEVVLWFEHDLFCQINLIYLLDWFSTKDLGDTRLSLICIDEFPGVEDFRGLGQLRGEQLASLFATRHQPDSAELQTARRAWAAYCSSDPAGLADLFREDLSPMPFLKQALHLHLSRFPSVRNGLGRIANQALNLIASKPLEFKSLFPQFANAEPLFGLGDGQLWVELKHLAGTTAPLIHISEVDNVDQSAESNQFHRATIELTETGKQILAGERDFVEINGIDLWLGGVHLTAGNLWRWDEQRGMLAGPP